MVERPSPSARAAPRPSRVAVIAFTTQPGLGSEYEVGWRWSLLAGEVARAVVLTRRECWNAIPGRGRTIRAMRIKRSHGVLFVAIDLPAAPRIFPHRRLTRTHYFFWQVLVLAWLRRTRESFGMAHHLNFVAAWFPPFAAFAGLPLLWGPIGTNPPIPKVFLRKRGWKARFKALARRLVTVEMVRFNPLLHLAAPRISQGFAITDYVRSLLPPSLRGRTDVHPAIALDGTWGGERRERETDLILFVGRAIDVKLPHLAFDAAARTIQRRGQGRAVLIGEHLTRFLRDASSAQGVEVRDSVPQDELRALYREAGLFLFPSLEGSGFVTLEAMANGLPVVCLEGTGTSEIAGPDASFAVTPTADYTATVELLADAMVALLDNPQARASAGVEARKRVEQFQWSSYRTFLERMYRQTAPQISPDVRKHFLA